MTVNFPSSPSQGDTYTYEAITYTFDGEKWVGSTASSFNDVTISGASANVILQGNDSITTDQTFTFSDQGGKLVPYQQGLWTPTYGADGTDPTVSYATQDGTFSRVGNLVTATYRIDISTKSGGSGNLQVEGFPYAAQNRNARAGAGVGYSSGWLNNKPPLSILATSNESFMRLYTRNTSTHGIISVGVADMGQAGCVLYGVISYQTEDTTWTPINGATVS